MESEFMQSDGEGWYIRNETHRKALLAYIEQNKNKDICFKVVQPTRTMKQNNGIHAYCGEVAKQMEARGLDMKTVLKEGVPISPTKELIKEYMWKPIQKALTGKESTTAITKKQVNEVYEYLSKLLAEKYDINVRLGK